MSQLNRRLVAAAVVAGAALLLFGRSGTIEAQQAGRPSDWVRIGRHRINGDRVCFMVDEGKDLVIDFGLPAGQIKLEGAEAEAMRRWVDHRSVDPLNAGKEAPPPPPPAR
jgi:hypothetical protein